MSELSPFRILAKEYSADLLTRDEYLTLRSNLLTTLQQSGSVSREDLENFVRLLKGKDEEEIKTNDSYSASDWLIILLGLIASLVLGYILYT